MAGLTPDEESAMLYSQLSSPFPSPPDASGLAQGVEDGRDRPGAATEDRPAAVGQDAGDVAGQAAARDVRHPRHAARGQRRPDGGGVDPCRLQQDVADGTVGAGHRRIDTKTQHVEDDAAREAVAVAVQPGRGQPEHDVTGLHTGAVDEA